VTDAARHAALRLVDVSKTYSATRALDHVSLTVLSGEVHGLVGGNGSGKSTLVRVVAGVEPADRGGGIEVRGKSLPARRMRPRLARRLGLRFVHQEPPVFPHLTVAENLAIGNGFDGARWGRIDWQALHSHAESVLARFGVEAAPKDRMSLLPPSARTLVAVARALHGSGGPGHVLLVDEPTAGLSAHEADVVLETLHGLADREHAVLFASHRLEEVLRYCERISILRDGKLLTTVDARCVTADQVATMIAGGPVQRAGGPTRSRQGETLLEVRALESAGLGPLTFDLHSGEVLGIAGPPGSDCSSLLQSIFGWRAIGAGEVRVGGQPLSLCAPADALAAGLAYVPADRARLASFPRMSVCENLFQMHVHGRSLLHHSAERESARRAIDSFRIRTRSEAAPMSTLSGGNQQKVVLARSLRRSPRVLLLDDPTQSVDVAARAEIHRFIRKAADEGAAALIVSSDLQELEQLADRVLIVGGAGVEFELEGRQASYERLVELSRHAAPAAA
jgi:ribose transport system ATP-binding protein